MSHRILRLNSVKDLTGLSRSSIYLKISHGQFPSAIKLGDRAVGWIEAEVNDWIKMQIELSGKRVEASMYV